MKKAETKRSRATGVREDEPLPEYDFRGGVRGKYAAEFAKGTNLILLDPDLADLFPDATSVNDALRAIAAIARRHKGARPRKARIQETVAPAGRRRSV
jgi:hypothetical protein